MRRSKDEQIEILAEALVETGFRLYQASGNNTPAGRLLSEWMQSIVRGHFVLEVSSSARRGTRALDRVGELLAIKSRHEFTIRTIDGREFSWEDARFVRIPRSPADNHEIFMLGGPYDAKGRQGQPNK